MEPTGIIYLEHGCKSGIIIIDCQHKNIVEVMNKIYIAVENDEIEGQLEKLINELDSYTIEHFETEEGYADKFNFPKTDELKKAHQFFKTTYNQLKSVYKEQNITEQAEKQKILHLHSIMKKWLKEHMRSIDKELCDFLRDKLEE